MNKKFLSASVFAAVVLLSAMLPAQATPITYALQNVTFTDGTSAAGSFVFDAATHKSSGYSIATRPGIMSAFNWNQANSGLYFGGGAGPNNFTLITTDGRRVFNFSFLAPFTDAGGTNLINIASTYECNNCGTFRRVNGGSVTSIDAVNVPEPGTLPLAFAALGVLGFLHRRRKQTA
ncbi:PEP-CTERM sorting domain-containing protein [Massilia sp. TWR1-2-2]|uniref:PEP-CTERM sorting domain-containing protein n=1 Tax=Massilia sp. TWR1-2-2 TaxID=2804584 RepID=UPI003CE6AB26